MTRCFQEPSPATGSQPSLIEKSQIIRSATQNEGTLSPTVVPTRTATSVGLPRRTAASAPLAIPITAESATAPNVRYSV